jgi:hypothetical protein
VASTYREFGGSRVGAAKIASKVYEVARGDTSASTDLCVGPQSTWNTGGRDWRTRELGARKLKAQILGG